MKHACACEVYVWFQSWSRIEFWSFCFLLTWGEKVCPFEVAVFKHDAQRLEVREYSSVGTPCTSGNTNLIILHAKTSYLRSGPHFILLLLFQKLWHFSQPFLSHNMVNLIFGCPPTFHNLGEVHIFILFSFFGTRHPFASFLAPLI
jgi:hypothetical protein